MGVFKKKSSDVQSGGVQPLAVSAVEAGSNEAPSNKTLPKKRPVIAVCVLLAILIAGASAFFIYNGRNNGEQTQSSEKISGIIDQAKQKLDEGDYAASYRVLIDIKDQVKGHPRETDYYVYLSQAAYGLQKKDEAKDFAKKGAELYKASENPNNGQGIILQSILSDTYYGIPAVEQVDKVKKEPTKEQLEDPEFQG